MRADAQFRRVTVSTTLNELARIFDRDHFAVVTQIQRMYIGGKGPATTLEKSVVVGVVSRSEFGSAECATCDATGPLSLAVDLLKYITSHTPASASSLPTAS